MLPEKWFASYIRGRYSGIGASEAAFARSRWMRKVSANISPIFDTQMRQASPPANPRRWRSVFVHLI
jgi:hypothetical protein